MVNSYINVEPKTALTQSPQITAQEAQRRYRQGEFLRRNHHLISPWMYDASTIGARNRALMLMHYDMAPKRETKYEHVVIPMSTLPPGNPLDAMLADGEIVVDEYPKILGRLHEGDEMGRIEITAEQVAVPLSAFSETLGESRT